MAEAADTETGDAPGEKGEAEQDSASVDFIWFYRVSTMEGT